MTSNTETSSKVLTFDTDRGATRSKWMAGALTLGIVSWMGSGFVSSSEAPLSEDKSVDVKLVSVAVAQSTAQVVPQVLTAEGQALPDRDTAIRTEISGTIADVLVSKGDWLEADQLIARFDTETARANLTQSEENLAQARREFDNALKLQDRGIATTDRVTGAKAGLAAAEAALVAAQDALSNGEIRSPFAGRLEELDFDAGEFVSAGSEVARVVDNTPLTVRIQIPQQMRKQAEAGQAAQISLITGEEVEGHVSFVGSAADSATRTFAAEVVIDNQDGAIPAGVSAQVKILTGELSAHFISPAILSLSTDGALGVKTVTEGNRVAFLPVQIVQAQTDGIWVSGLPDAIDLITIGQGFVNDGELVKPIVDGAVEEQTAAVDTDPAL